MSGFIGAQDRSGTHKSVEWYTPEWVFDSLGMEFDLDPCSPHDHPSFVPAAERYTVFDDGLSKDWVGTVWLNPPYGPSTGFWIRRLISHGTGIALVFSRTDASWFQEAMKASDAVLFVAGRVDFVPGHENKHKRSRSGAGSAFFAFGGECASALNKLSDRGVLFSRGTA